ESQGDGGVEMATGNVTDGVGHGENGESEGESYASEADTQRRESRVQNSGSASAKDQPECAEEFSGCALTESHRRPPVTVRESFSWEMARAAAHMRVARGAIAGRIIAVAG